MFNVALNKLFRQYVKYLTFDIIDSDPARLRMVAGIHKNSNKNGTQTTGIGNITIVRKYLVEIFRNRHLI